MNPIETKILSVLPNELVELGSQVRNYVGKFYQYSAPPAFTIFEMINGIVVNKLIGILVELNIPDILQHEDKSLESLAEDTQVNPNLLSRILDALVSLNLLEKTESNTYRNNHFSSVLRTDHPTSMRHAVLFMTDENYWNIWKKGLHTLKTGLPVTEAVYGKKFYDYLDEFPKLSEHFNNAMSNFTQIGIPLFCENYDFGSFTTIADIGSGNGTFLSEILLRHEHLKGTWFDSQLCKEQAFLLLESYQLHHRVTMQVGSFFDFVPPNIDLYLLKTVLHNWSDEDCLKILSNLRKSMHSTSKVLVIEKILPQNLDYNFTRISDVHMLFLTGGKERTLEEMETLTQKAGLRIRKLLTLPTSDSLIELELIN